MFTTTLEKTIAGIIVLLLAFMFWSIWYNSFVTVPRAFEAWEKQTGNPQHLTFDEWNSLRNATKDNKTVIFMH